jgi:hypothetical protein
MDKTKDVVGQELGRITVLEKELYSSALAEFTNGTSESRGQKTDEF